MCGMVLVLVNLDLFLVYYGCVVIKIPPAEEIIEDNECHVFLDIHVLYSLKEMSRQFGDLRNKRFFGFCVYIWTPYLVTNSN